MSMKYFGPHFDVHTGAVDNIFPHHENEIAQSEAATGQKFVDLWLHAEHLIVDGEKMSKSKGNFYTLDDVLAQRNDPVAVRYLLLSVPYRKKLNFTWDALTAASSAVERIRSAVQRIDEAAAAGSGKPGAYPGAEKAAQFAAGFTAALDDDLNTALALGVLFTFLREINAALVEGTLDAAGAAAAGAALRKADLVLGVLPSREEALSSEIEAMIEARNAARRRRDFAESDRIRAELSSRGILLEDGSSGTRWKRA
jgi:cysteinyl-tRNA synthetase